MNNLTQTESAEYDRLWAKFYEEVGVEVRAGLSAEDYRVRMERFGDGVLPVITNGRLEGESKSGIVNHPVRYGRETND